MGHLMDRREFLYLGAAGVFVGGCDFGRARPEREALVRFGMVTDLHYADLKPTWDADGIVGRRYFRESVRKLGEAVEVFNARQVDFAIELGDFKDLTKGATETLACLDEIEACFAKFKGARYHVAGNHDFDCLAPGEFFSRVPNDGKISEQGYYSFVKNGVTFLVLDACYDSQLRHYSRANPWADANVPPNEMAWLERELSAARGHVIVFCHQRLDPAADPAHRVKNADALRALFEKSGKVRGVFTGHQHNGGASVVNGIPYYTLRALVCASGEGNNSFAEVAIYSDGTFTVKGWRNAVSQGVEGEFPAGGTVARDVPTPGAAMVVLEAWRGKKDGTGPTLEEALAAFPKTGVYLAFRYRTRVEAEEVANLLRRTGRLAQGILLTPTIKEQMYQKRLRPWQKSGFVMGERSDSAAHWTDDEITAKLREAAGHGAEMVQLPPNRLCTGEQAAFLRERGIRTISFAADGAPAQTRDGVPPDFICQRVVNN